MPSAQALTLSEAGYVLDRPPALLNKAVDTGVIRARQRRVGSAIQRLLGPAEMRFLLVAERLDKDLTPRGRRRLYDAIRQLDDDVHRISLGEVVLDLGKVDRDLQIRLERLEALRGCVEPVEDGTEPVIKGTRIPVYMVAALARKQTAAEIGEDFPSLSRKQIEGAIEYAKAYPKRGRPYPTTSLKRALADLAELGAFDESADDTTASPREIP